MRRPTWRSLGAALVLSTLLDACASAPKPKDQPFAIELRNAEDRAVMELTETRLTVQVMSLGGLGGALLRTRERAFPTDVRWVLPSLSQLESYKAGTAGNALLCSLLLSNQRGHEFACTFNDKAFTMMLPPGEDARIDLPPELLLGGPKVLEIEWVAVGR